MYFIRKHYFLVQNIFVLAVCFFFFLVKPITKFVSNILMIHLKISYTKKTIIKIVIS